MKALDTPVLLDLLRGSQGVLRLIRSLSGEELATTELNLLELEYAGRAASAAGRDRRIASIDRLRRKLTVLSVDGRSVRLTAQWMARFKRPMNPWMWVILGILEANGCSEWIVGSPPLVVHPGLAAVKIRKYVR